LKESNCHIDLYQAGLYRSALTLSAGSQSKGSITVAKDEPEGEPEVEVRTDVLGSVFRRGVSTGLNLGRLAESLNYSLTSRPQEAKQD
jgi:hypothetical protein